MRFEWTKKSVSILYYKFPFTPSPHVGAETRNPAIYWPHKLWNISPKSSWILPECYLLYFYGGPYDNISYGSHQEDVDAIIVL